MEPPSSHSIAILNETGRRMPVSLLRRSLSAVLHRHGKAQATVSVLLTTDDPIRELNRNFRKIDEATDVLTFPSANVPGAPLGDIAISVEFAERQAKVRRVSLSQELGYLAIHGALHLVGFDDESDEDREKMVFEMNEAAREAGLKPDLEWSSMLHEPAGDAS